MVGIDPHHDLSDHVQDTIPATLEDAIFAIRSPSSCLGNELELGELEVEVDLGRRGFGLEQLFHARLGVDADGRYRYSDRQDHERADHGQGTEGLFHALVSGWSFANQRIWLAVGGMAINSGAYLPFSVFLETTAFAGNETMVTFVTHFSEGTLL